MTNAFFALKNTLSLTSRNIEAALRVGVVLAL